MWSSGLSCGGSISSVASRSRSSRGRRGCRATRSGGRCAASGRRAIRGRRGPSVLEPFKDEIHRLLREDPKLPGVRVRELLEPLGCTAGKTVVDDYLREVRPLFAPAPQDVSADGLSAGGDLPVRCLAARAPRCRSATARPAAAGSSSRAWATRAPARACWCSRRRPRTCWPGSPAAFERLGALPETLVWDRQAGIHGHGGRPTEAFAAFCGQLKVGWRFCEPADPQAKGAVERLQGYAETNFEPGRVFANELDFQDQLDAWFPKVNARTHKTLRARPVDRLADEHEVMAALPRADARHRAALGHPGRAGSLSARRHQRLLARPARWSAAASRSASISARSGRSRWTPARSPAGTARRSRGTARSPRSSTPARCATAASDAAAETRSRSGRWPATTR